MKPILASLMIPLAALLASFSQLPSRAAEEPFAFWARSHPGSSSGGNNAIFLAASPAGNAYLIQEFYGPNYDSYTLMKYDPQGKVISSNALSSLPGQLTYARGILEDATGSVFLAGARSNDFSVVKLDAAGALVWKTNTLNATSSAATAVAINSSGSGYVIGGSQGPVSFGGIDFPDGSGLLLCRLNPTGAVLWVKRILDATASNLNLDQLGNVYFSGFLPANGPMDFLGTTVNPGNSPNSSNFGGDYFVAKCDPNGNLLWVHVGDLHLTDTLTYSSGISSAVDRQGNTYFLEGGTWFGKLDPGGALLWYKEFPGAYLAQFDGIVIAASDEPLFCGGFQDSATFDNIVLRTASPSDQDIFLAKTDANGNVKWALRAGGAYGGAIAADAEGNIFIRGEFAPNGTLDGLAVSGRTVAKLLERPLLRITNSVGSATVTYPAKATNYVLEAATSLPAASWTAVTNTATVSGRDRRVQLPLTGPAKFFRLRKP